MTTQTLQLQHIIKSVVLSFDSYQTQFYWLISSLPIRKIRPIRILDFIKKIIYEPNMVTCLKIPFHQFRSREKDFIFDRKKACLIESISPHFSPAMNYFVPPFIIVRVIFEVINIVVSRSEDALSTVLQCSFEEHGQYWGSCSMDANAKHL